MRGEISLERSAAVATVTVSQPEKLNAMSVEMWKSLKTIMDDLSADSTVRCVVIRGAGHRAFSAGADISEFDEVRAGAVQARAYAEITQAALHAVAACPHPTVAAIRGNCVGGGLELASVCDMRISAEDGRFGVPINRLGLVVSYLELKGLMTLIGKSRTLELLLEGRVFGAQEAFQKGLVNRVVSCDAWEGEVADTATRIASGAPLVARWHKKFVSRLEMPEPLREDELDEVYHCFDTEDFRIGSTAFKSKTQPVFTGH